MSQLWPRSIKWIYYVSKQVRNYIQAHAATKERPTWYQTLVVVIVLAIMGFLLSMVPHWLHHSLAPLEHIKS